jgi:hypothetical protein
LRHIQVAILVGVSILKAEARTNTAAGRPHTSEGVEEHSDGLEAQTGRLRRKIRLALRPSLLLPPLLRVVEECTWNAALYLRSSSSLICARTERRLAAMTLAGTVPGRPKWWWCPRDEDDEEEPDELPGRGPKL